eukprot:16430212-Heterocapsa_arctica.AAC.3
MGSSGWLGLLGACGLLAPSGVEAAGMAGLASGIACGVRHGGGAAAAPEAWLWDPGFGQAPPTVAALGPVRVGRHGGGTIPPAVGSAAGAAEP